MPESDIRFANINYVSTKPEIQVLINVDHVAYVIRKAHGTHKIFLLNNMSFEISVDDMYSIGSLKEAGIHLY